MQNSNESCPYNYQCENCQFDLQGKEKSGCICGYKTTFHIKNKN